MLLKVEFITWISNNNISTQAKKNIRGFEINFINKKNKQIHISYKSGVCNNIGHSTKYIQKIS